MYLKELVTLFVTTITTAILSVLGMTTPTKVGFGIYDYGNQFSSLAKVTIQHEYIGWNNYVSPYTVSILEKASDNHRQLLITLEPWPIYSDLSDTKSLFDDIISGKYDQKIKEICTDLSRSGALLLRWGHEMDQGPGRYTWSGGEASKYIQSYQHFVTSCRSVAPAIKYVWSPAGNKNLSGYYPGDDYVDEVGLSLYYYPEWQSRQNDKTTSFAGLFSPKYNLVKKYKKPVIIAELGATGTSEFQKKWLTDAFELLSSFPLLKQVVYFSSPDHPGVWGKDLPIPDWRLSRPTLESLLIFF